MNGLEISLRNSLHRAITDFHQTEDWFESVLSENTPEYWKRQLASINRRLREEGKVGNPDQVVASLEFGFWTHLFTSKYEGKGKIWPGLLENVFPHMPRRLRTRQQLHNRLDKCRRLRNRISHHEPIWRSNDLVNTHQEMIDLICWINPQVRALVQLLDRFQEIHSNGIPHYRTLVDEFLNQR